MKNEMFFCWDTWNKIKRLHWIIQLTNFGCWLDDETTGVVVDVVSFSKNYCYNLLFNYRALLNSSTVCSSSVFKKKKLIFYFCVCYLSWWTRLTGPKKPSEINPENRCAQSNSFYVFQCSNATSATSAQSDDVELYA